MSYIRIDWDALDVITDPVERYREAGRAIDQTKDAASEISTYQDGVLADVVAAQPRPHGAQIDAARALGLSRATLGDRLRRHKQRTESPNEPPTLSYGNDGERILAEADRQREIDGGTMAIYGYWGDYQQVAGSSLTIEASVSGVLGEWAEDYDVDGLVAEFREAINAALPEGMVLSGDEFAGPYHERPRWDGEVLSEIVEAVDFWAIAEQHKH